MIKSVLMIRIKNCPDIHSPIIHSLTSPLNDKKLKKEVGIEWIQYSATKSEETRNKILGRENILA